MLIRQHISLVDQEYRQFGSKIQRAVITVQRLVEPAEPRQRSSTIIEDVQITRLQGENAVIIG